MPPVFGKVRRILGTDATYFACEGRLVLFVWQGHGESIRRIIQEIEEHAAVIGTVCAEGEKIVRLRPRIGGQKILSVLQNEMIPRIC